MFIINNIVRAIKRIRRARHVRHMIKIRKLLAESFKRGHFKA
jgi:hypothetical protein